MEAKGHYSLGGYGTNSGSGNGGDINIDSLVSAHATMNNQNAHGVLGSSGGQGRTGLVFRHRINASMSLMSGEISIRNVGKYLVRAKRSA